VNVFVCHTRRDGMVTSAMLRHLHTYLSGIGSPFIHTIEEQKLRWQQIGVLSALLRSTLILLIVSPEVQRSHWVQLELWIAKLLLRPVFRLYASELAEWRSEA
jgi:hypothetical protein